MFELETPGGVAGMKTFGGDRVVSRRRYRQGARLPSTFTLRGGRLADGGGEEQAHSGAIRATVDNRRSRLAGWLPRTPDCRACLASQVPPLGLQAFGQAAAKNWREQPTGHILAISTLRRHPRTPQVNAPRRPRRPNGGMHQDLVRQVRSAQHVTGQATARSRGTGCSRGMTAGMPFGRRWSGGIPLPGLPFGTEQLSVVTVRQPLGAVECPP